MKGYKTKQREQIIAFFESDPDRCCSAREIIESGCVDAGQATVYRTLSLLSDENVLRRFHSASGGDLYRLACNATDECHIHIVCRSCGDMIHSECGFVEKLREHLASEHDFLLDTGRTIIYGICGKCASGGKA